MADYLNISGRVRTTANDGISLEAQEIFDNNKGKKQNQINAETDAALDDRYTKDETYSKEQLNNMITTPEQQYVTVDATSETTPQTLAALINGSGQGEASDTVYRVGNWDGSQFDASVYSEYAWNGTQYIHLNTKTQVGEVFDISAYHATGGTLATYADLSSALDSNNGGGVPQLLQKGGMSIKFVQSSDNKYVQFRLMSQTFSTTESDWQGVDDKPKAGSRNLVESGGTSQILGNDYNKWFQGYIDGTTGNLVDYSTRVTSNFLKKPSVKINAGFGIFSVSYYNTDYTFRERVTLSGGVTVWSYDGDYIVRITVYAHSAITPQTNFLNSLTCDSLLSNIHAEKNRAEGAESTLQQAITTEKNRAEGAELVLQQTVNIEKAKVDNLELTVGVNDGKWVQGYINSTTGELAYMSNRVTSSFLKKPSIVIKSPFGIFSVSYYNADYTFRERVELSSGTRRWSYNGDYLVRITVYSNSDMTTESDFLDSLTCDSILSNISSVLPNLQEDLQDLQKESYFINAKAGTIKWYEKNIDPTTGELVDYSGRVTSDLMQKPQIVIKSPFAIFAYALYNTDGTFRERITLSGGVRSWSYNGNYLVRITVYDNNPVTPSSDFLDSLKFGYDSLYEKTATVEEMASSILGKRITGCGDSLSAGSTVEAGFYEKTLAALGGGIYNGIYSYGGTMSFPTGEHDTQHRIKRFVENDTNTDILILENVNDSWGAYTIDNNVLTKKGNIQDFPFMFSKYETSSTSYETQQDAINAFEENFSSFVQGIANKTKGTVLRIPYGTSKIVLTINSGTSSNGTIKISIGSDLYNVTVNSGLTASEVAEIIALTQFVGYSVSVSNNIITFVLESGYSLETLTFDGNGTGSTATSTTTSASNYLYKFFMGTTSDEFVVKASWCGSSEISLYSVYKGIIEYLQSNKPELRIVWFIPTTWILDFTTPDSSMINADGSWNLSKIHESSWNTYYYTRMRLLREIQTEVCRYYGIECYNAMENVGITPFNVETYYYSGDVHPKEITFIKWSEFLYKMMK